MPPSIYSPQLTAGADLRTRPEARGLALAGLAHRPGRSVGWLSRVDRDMSDMSQTDPGDIALRLNVCEDLLPGQEAPDPREAGHVVRRFHRRPVGSHVRGLIEKHLSPDPTDDFETAQSTFAPGSRMVDPVQRPTQKIAVIDSGALDPDLDSLAHMPRECDSFRIRGEALGWSNPCPDQAVAILINASPVY